MADPMALTGGGPVLVLAPHPDDESLGCGALLAACWRQDIAAHVACLTDGAASHPRTVANLTAIREAELRRAVSLLGGDPACDLTFMGHPDAALHTIGPDMLTRQVTALADAMGVRTLIAPSPLDLHCDHVTAAELAMRVVAVRPALRLLFYPIWSRWVGGGIAPAVPGTARLSFDNLSARPAKASAIAAHVSQITGLQDDPDGFVMPDGFAAMFADTPEIFDMRLR